MSYWILRTAISVILKSFFRLKVEGLENLPQKTNFIIVANHTSYLDPLLVMVAVPRKIYCVAARYLYKIFWLRWFLRKTETFPSGRSSDKAVYFLTKNKNVGLFPEGGCSHDGKLKKFKRGSALLALKTGRPIVPCAILGAYRAFPKGVRFPKLFLPLKVKVGKPIYLLKQFGNIIDDIYLQEGIFKLRNAIREMIDAG